MRDLYNEGWKYITCYVDGDGKLCPMGEAKNKEYAIDCAKRHKHILCRLVKLEAWPKERNQDSYSAEQEHTNLGMNEMRDECSNVNIVVDIQEIEKIIFDVAESTEDYLHGHTVGLMVKAISTQLSKFIRLEKG